MNAMSEICGIERVGETGVVWVCVRAPHDAEGARDFMAENTVNGAFYPESERHHFISAEEYERRNGHPLRTDVR